MNYTELKAAVAETTENTFTDTQQDIFFRGVEEEIYALGIIPASRETSTGTANIGNRFLTLPTDHISTHHLAVKSTSGVYNFLINKEPSFIRSAYADPTYLAMPKYYAQFDENTLLLGPTPDAYYSVELQYMRYPTTITTAGTNWVGDNFPDLLLNGALVRAARFMKEEEDVIKNYEKLFQNSLKLLEQYTTGTLQKDSFRDGEARKQVRRV